MKEQIKYRGFWIEIRALFSNEPSYFSKKRIESAAWFLSAFVAITTYTWIHIMTLSPTDIVLLTGAMIASAMGTVSSIQKEKRDESK